MSSFANPLTDYTPQSEVFESAGQTYVAQPDGVFSEDEELQLASELLELVDEQELDQFLGDLINKAGKAIGSFVDSPVGRAVGGVLKAVAKTTLPIAGGALGGFVGGPIGAMLGSNLASVEGSALGLELEGLSPEDSEFEAARQFVRFAGATVTNAMDSRMDANPTRVAEQAAREAARLYAPGLMNIGAEGTEIPEMHLSGRWIRRGHSIVLFGA